MGRRNPPLWRIAMRMHAAYLAARDDVPAQSLPEYQWQDCRSALSRLEAATSRGWFEACRRLQSIAQAELNRLQIRLEELSRSLRRPEPHVPGVRFFFEELTALADEFDDLAFRDGVLSVTTSSITLEGFELGSFSIRLRTDRVRSDSCYGVVALEPNPAASCSATTHPHVHDERLCAGEGKPAITAALKEGRLFDFFTIVDRILHTYAEGAAYVELKDWQGIPCHDCDGTVNPHERLNCQDCEETLCNDCLVCCEACNTGYCSNCIERCSLCDYRYCEGCLMSCGRCRRQVCESCLERKLCHTCVEELDDAREELDNDQEETDSPPEPAESPLQPDGVRQAASPA